jgi:hypothetical protein
MDGASETALRQGALSNNPGAFDRLLGFRGVLVRTECVERRSEDSKFRFFLLDRGKQFQKVLRWEVEMDDYTGGEFYAK